MKMQKAFETEVILIDGDTVAIVQDQDEVHLNVDQTRRLIEWLQSRLCGDQFVEPSQQ